MPSYSNTLIGRRLQGFLSAMSSLALGLLTEQAWRRHPLRVLPVGPVLGTTVSG